MNQETTAKRKVRNRTFAIKVNVRKDEDREKLMRVVYTAIRKAGRLGTVQVFIGETLEKEIKPRKGVSSPKTNQGSKGNQPADDSASLLD